MIKKNKHTKFFLMSILGVVITSSILTSCSVTSQNQSGITNNIVEPTIQRKDDDLDELKNFSWKSYNGSIDKQILESAQVESSNIKIKSTNKFNQIQNYKNAELRSDFSSYIGEADKIIDDLNIFVFQTFLLNDRKANFKNFRLNNENKIDLKKLKKEEVSKVLANGEESKINDENKFELEKFKVSFDFTFDIEGYLDITFIKILNRTFELKKGETISVNINANNQVLLPSINKQSESYFLGWKLNLVNVGIKKGDFIEVFNSEFSPTINNPSSAFKIIFDNLDDKKNYLDLLKENKKSITDLNLKEIQKNIEDQIIDKYKKQFIYFKNIRNFLAVLKSNPTAKEFLTKASPFLVDIFVSAKLLPIEIKGLFNQIFLSNKPLIHVLRENNKGFIDSFDGFGKFKGIIETIANIAKISNKEEKISENDLALLTPLFALVPQNLESVIKNDFLGMNNKPKSLLSIIVDNIDKILEIPFKDNPNALKSLSGLVRILFNADERLDKPILDVLASDLNAKKNLINVIFEIASIDKSIQNIINIFVLDYKEFNSKNILSLLNSFFDFVNVLFEEDINSKTPDIFNTNFKNISFENRWINHPKIINNKLFFNYQVKFSINKKATFDISKLKNLVSEYGIVELAKEHAKTDLSQQLPSSFYSVIKDLLFNFIPDTISIGGENKTSIGKIEISANNSQINFKPIKSDTLYFWGYQFGYVTNITYQDVELLKSFTNRYSKKYDSIKLLNILNAQFFYSDFWESLLKNMIFKNHTFLNSMQIKANDKNPIASINDYNEESYIAGFDVEWNKQTFNDTDFVNEFVTKKQEIDFLNENVKNAFSKVKWRNEFRNTTLKGLKVTIDEDLSKLIFNRNFSNTFNLADEWTKNYVNDNLNNLSSYSWIIVPLFDFNAPIQTLISQSKETNKVLLSISLKGYQAKLYLPFKYYDAENKRMTDEIDFSKFKVNFKQNDKLSFNN